MKIAVLIVSLLFGYAAQCQFKASRNIFIITTDGFRWQEVFRGADSALIKNSNYVMDTALARQLYWDNDISTRRKKLMPFFWNVIANQGQLYGNRDFNNKVNVKNIYKISYPGYNELLTGYADMRPFLNLPLYNDNITILEYLNSQKQFEGSVAAFSSWNIFPFILNSKRNNMVMNNGYQHIEDHSVSDDSLINKVQDAIPDKGNTRQDALTYITAKEYIIKNHPRVVFISLGETDEFAHEGRYDLYLQKANCVDRMISELWYYVQTDSFYRDNTTFIITTDHGRGVKPGKWYTHNCFTKGSGEIWLGLLGANIEATGELKEEKQVYQDQIASTISALLGTSFTHTRGSSKPISLLQPHSAVPVLSIASFETHTRSILNRSLK